MNYELVLVIVNSGYSEQVMDVAKEVGVRGGTVFNALGTAKEEAEKAFGIAIQPQKEVVMMVIDSSIKSNLLHQLYQQVGLKTPGQGIAFSLPIEEVVGLTPINQKELTKLDEKDSKVDQDSKNN